MASLARRFLSTTACRRVSAKEACQEISDRFGSQPVSIRKQRLDANQFHLLNITLGRSPTSNTPPPNGSPLPPGYHLVYFTPAIHESELGLDGTDRTVNPLSPYTRRMWAGGELTWSQSPSSLLRVGQQVTETTKMLSAEPKKLKRGGEMLVVGLEKTFENDAGVALVDKRNWVFQREIDPSKATPPPPIPETKPLPKGEHVRDVTQSEVTLFRFSALTFNGHKIHYSPEWCRKVEGHRNTVVHGPLNLIHMLDFWRDASGGGDQEAVPQSIAYRAMSPLYVGEPYRILLDGKESEEQRWTMEIWDNYGRMSMKAEIVA